MKNKKGTQICVPFMELLGGFEPPTSSLPRTRSTNWAIAAHLKHYYDIIVKKTINVKPKKGDFEKKLKKNEIVFWSSCQIGLFMIKYIGIIELRWRYEKTKEIF